LLVKLSFFKFYLLFVYFVKLYILLVGEYRLSVSHLNYNWLKLAAESEDFIYVKITCAAAAHFHHLYFGEIKMMKMCW